MTKWQGSLIAVSAAMLAAAVLIAACALLIWVVS